MNSQKVPGGRPSSPRTVPRWMVLVYWAIGLLVVHNLAPWALHFITVRLGWVAGRPGPWNLAALAVAGAALVGIVWTMAVHYAHIPRQVPLERTSRYLVTDGPYRFSRNPMYIAELALWLGWALFYGSVAVGIAVALLAGAMHYRVVPREERDMTARFGDAYRQYARRVPRWFGPAHPPDERRGGRGR